MSRGRLPGRQREALRAIMGGEHSIAGVGRALGVNRSTAHGIVHRLVDRGLVDVDPATQGTVRPRALEEASRFMDWLGKKWPGRHDAGDQVPCAVCTEVA